jgi:hypothetical protein
MLLKVVGRDLILYPQWENTYFNGIAKNVTISPFKHLFRAAGRNNEMHLNNGIDGIIH